MKTFKTFLLLGCLSVLTFASCTTNEEDPTLTKEEINLAYQSMKGDYAGNLIYTDPSTTSTNDANDTLSVNWQINSDSMLVIKNLPSKPIAAVITDSKLRAAIAEQPTQELKCYYSIYNVSPVGFLVNPLAATFNVTADGTSHTIQVAFYVYNRYSYRVYNATSNLMQMQVLIGGVYVDGALDKTLLSSTAFLGFSGTKQ